MSAGYNNGLSEYPNKGTLNLKESEEADAVVHSKASQLAKMISQSETIIFHTGAGISTSAGIPDFRGPKGVWTLEAKGVKVDEGKKWVDTVPSYTHMGWFLFCWYFNKFLQLWSRSKPMVNVSG